MSHFRQTSWFVALLVCSATAHAQELTIGDVATQMHSQMEGFIQLIAASSFLMGLGLAGVTMFSFKSYAKGQGTLGKPLAMAMMAAALIGCPTFLRMAHDTLEPQSVEATNASQTRSGALQPKAQVQIEQEQDFTTGRKPDGRKGGF